MTATHDTRNAQFVIVGAGPAGIGAAITLAKRGYSSTVYDALPKLVSNNEESYPIGINPRGQHGLDHIDPNITTQIKADPMIDYWNIYAGKTVVAKFPSGTTVGSTRAGVTFLLYESAVKQYSDLIKFEFSHKLVSIDHEKKQLTFENTKTKEQAIVDASDKRIIAADGVWSKVRRELEKSTKLNLRATTDSWNTSFRLLFSTKNPKTDLKPKEHYIFSGLYVAVIDYTCNQWVAVVQVNSGPNEKQLLSNEPTEENQAILKNLVKESSPEAYAFIPEEEYTAFFNRRSFTGAVVQLNRLNVDEWVLFLGDSAHAVNPATGEGVNAAIEDSFILGQVLDSSSNIDTLFTTFNERRLKDVVSLTDYARYLLYNWSSPTYEKIARTLTMITLQFGKRLGLVSETWNDKSFGSKSSDHQPYSKLKATWDRQSFLLLPFFRVTSYALVLSWRLKYLLAFSLLAYFGNRYLM